MSESNPNPNFVYFQKVGEVTAYKGVPKVTEGTLAKGLGTQMHPNRIPGSGGNVSLAPMENPYRLMPVPELSGVHAGGLAPASTMVGAYSGYIGESTLKPMKSAFPPFTMG